MTNEITNTISTLIARGKTIATMESCTGGALASAITDVSGASEIFKGSFIAYSNEAKILCNVSSNVIEKYGVYSQETARAMADSARAHFGADIGIGITGSLGRKDPNNSDSEVGTVYYCISTANSKNDERYEIEVLHLPASLKTRREMKDYIVEKILNHLQRIN